MAHLRLYLQECNASLWFHNSLIQQIAPLGDFDLVLIDDICRSGLSKSTVNQLNLVRLYLRVETLSDLCNIRGDSIVNTVLSQKKTS